MTSVLQSMTESHGKYGLTQEQMVDLAEMDADLDEALMTDARVDAACALYTAKRV